MAQVDASATEPLDELVRRAGFAIAVEARRLLRGTYGRRVSVVAGKGNNGADGRVAATVLRRWGAQVRVVDAADAPSEIRDADLVIDAAYGTGFRGEYRAPDCGRTPVLSVDIPSGIDGLTGAEHGRAPSAAVTVTFGAHKPGLLFGAGAERSGQVRVAGIGLDCGTTRTWLVGDTDVALRWPRRSGQAHKWRAAVWVIGGSPGMTGAPALASRGAFRSGAGYVRVSSPGTASIPGAPLEAVTTPLPLVGWNRTVPDDAARFGALVVGPGLGRSDAARDAVLQLVDTVRLPVVLDGDGLWAFASGSAAVPSSATVIVTPHDGEYTQLCGTPPGPDRVEAARHLARSRGVTVLLKGPTTVVATPAGEARIVASGSSRLATAGTGDVLSGVIGALIAAGAGGFDAAWLAAHVHGRAAAWCPDVGAVAGDVADALPVAISSVIGPDVDRRRGSWAP